MVGNEAVTFFLMFLAVWADTALVSVSAELLDVPKRTAIIELSVFLFGASVIMMPEIARIVGIIRRTAFRQDTREACRFAVPLRSLGNPRHSR